MDREFEFAANGWLTQCSADIKGKIENLLNENDSNPEELADEINVPVEEVYDILEGDASGISVDTLIRVFMVLGLAVEIKPIEDTPLGGYDNVNPHVMREPQHEERREPRPNPFMRPKEEDFMPPFPPRMGRDFGDIPPHVREQFERRNPTPQHRPTGAVGGTTSPFATKTRDELVHIIRKHLWDTEIDTNSASKEALVRFLNEKDRRTKEFKRTEELERDPKVADFISRMKQTIKDNPQFRSYVKNFLGALDEN